MQKGCCRMKPKAPRIIDCLIHLGRNLNLEDYQVSTPDSIEHVLDKYGMSGALVCAFACSLNIDVEYGNEQLFKTTDGNKRLIPCPAIIPSEDGSTGSEEKCLDGLIEKGARCCYIFHTQVGVPLDKRVVGPLFAALEKRRLPIALFSPEITEAATLASEYPQLPVLIHGPSLRNRAFMPLFVQTRNLHFSMAANYSHYRGLEKMSRGNGADRIVFASGYPVAEPGASIANLFYSDLSERISNKIASGNIERLMSAIRSGSGSKKLKVFKAGPARFDEASAPQSVLSVRNRKPIPWDGVVDMHGHYGRAGKFPIWGGAGDDLVRELDRIGVEKIIVSHQAGISSPEVRWGNDQVLAAIKRYPGRIAGYAVCYPVEKRLGFDEIRRCIESGMTGIKIHTANGLAYTDPRYRPVWRLADRLKLPVLLHTWGDMDEYEEIFRKYRRVPVLLGHSGAINVASYVKYARKYKNIYLELAYSGASYGLVEHFVKKVGAGRVIYGSDAPWMAMQQQLGRVLFADISENDKKKILKDNAHRILKQVAK